MCIRTQSKTKNAGHLRLFLKPPNNTRCTGRVTCKANDNSDCNADLGLWSCLIKLLKF